MSATNNNGLTNSARRPSQTHGDDFGGANTASLSQTDFENAAAAAAGRRSPPPRYTLGNTPSLPTYTMATGANRLNTSTPSPPPTRAPSPLRRNSDVQPGDLGMTPEEYQQALYDTANYLHTWGKS
jgi:hypothetical protein